MVHITPPRRSLVTLVAVAGLLAMPPTYAAFGHTRPYPFVEPHQYQGKDLIVVMGIGTAKNESHEPGAFDLTVPLISTTGAVVGHVRHQPRCSTSSVPCMVLDDHDTFGFGDGTIITRGPVSAPPDPDNVGFLLTSAQPPGDNIVSGTGAYEGRSGTVRVFGYVDARRAPDEFTLHETYVIALNPK